MKKLILSLLILSGLCFTWNVTKALATVTSTSNQVIYAGDGTSTNFNFSFNVFNTASENDLVVSKQVVATGAITTLVLNTDYTISLTHAIPSPGSITLTGGALAIGTNLSILRQLPLTQQVNISDNSATPAATTNSVYDRAIMITQQLQQQLTRAILQNIFSTTQVSLPAGVAGLVLCWDPTATAITNCTATGVQTIPVPIPDTYLQTIATTNVVNGSSVVANSIQRASINWTSLNSDIQRGAVNWQSITSYTAGNILSATNTNGVNWSTIDSLEPYVKVSNTQTSGTKGGDSTSGSWLTYPLNTEDNDPTNIATLSTNIVTLPAGTYEVRGFGTFYFAGLGTPFSAQVRLFNSTDSSVLVVGSSEYVDAPSTTNPNIKSYLAGYFTLSASKALVLQYQVTTSQTSGLGHGGALGTEVYAALEFYKRK